jgi:hypothetical protein
MFACPYLDGASLSGSRHEFSSATCRLSASIAVANSRIRFTQV